MSLSAARQALRRARATESDESGFVLIYVLMVITIVTVLVTSVLVVSASSVIPSQQASYDQAAAAAAQGGIQAFVSTLDTDCGTSTYGTVSACTTQVPGSKSGTIYTQSGYTSSYAWSAKPTSDGSAFRVTSIGTVTQGGVGATKKLVADISGGASSKITDYSSVTQYETQAPDMMALLFPAGRTINLTGAFATQVGLGNQPTSVTWNGPGTSSTPGSVNVCNDEYYGSTGREFNPPPGAPSPFVDWEETGTAGGKSVTDYQPCQVTLGSSTKLLAPAVSTGGPGGYGTNDALLFSNTDPGSSGGPLLDQPVTTEYSAATDPNGVAGQNYRSFILPGYGVQVGGSPAAGSLYSPTVASKVIQPIATKPTIPTGSCVYQGPTRILLNGSSATVTSPETTTAQPGSPAGCYPSSLAGGIATFTIANLSALSGFSGVFSVINSGTAPASPPALHTSTGWNAVNPASAITSSNSVFYNSIPASGPTSSVGYLDSAADKGYAPAVGDNPSTKSDGSWSPAWTSYSSGTTCNTSTAITDLKFFNCYEGGGSYSATAYTALKSTVQAALLANPQNYTSAAALQTYLNSLLAAGDSSDANNSTPTNSTNASHRWSATVTSDASPTGGCTPNVGPTSGPSTSTINAPYNGDPMFNNASGMKSTTTQLTTTCLTATVTLQVGVCAIKLLTLCTGNGWGSPVLGQLLGNVGGTIPQLSMTETVGATTTTTSTTAATSSFPLAGDASFYGMGPTGSTSTTGPGDLYVQGTSSVTLSLAAANDVIITGSLQPSSPTSTALEVVAQDNVRVYHPVTCVSGTPSNGYCANDLTGLYSSIPADGYRPYQQYANARSDLANISINAALFALGLATSTVSCPQWNGGGICGGEITVDNYNRGTTLGTLSVTGTMYQAHHGALGEDWEVPDSSGQIPPQTGYNLTDTYQNLSSLIAGVNVVNTQTTTSAFWHIVSVSTGTS